MSAGLAVRQGRSLPKLRRGRVETDEVEVSIQLRHLTDRILPNR